MTIKHDYDVIGGKPVRNHTANTALSAADRLKFDIKARLPNIPNDYAIVLAYIRSVGIGRESSIQADTDPNTGSEEQNGDDVPDTTT